MIMGFSKVCLSAIEHLRNRQTGHYERETIWSRTLLAESADALHRADNDFSMPDADSSPTRCII